MSIFGNNKVKWDEPVFIIGNPRSGTSLLRLILHSHSAICIPPESHFFLWLEDKYKNWDLAKLDNYLEDLFNSTKFETWNIDRKELKEFILKENPNSYAQLNCLVYLTFNKNPEKNIVYWGDKNKLWKDKLGDVGSYYPKAKYIHLIRDGRDVACSFKDLGAKKMSSKYAPKLPTEISEIALRWQRNIAFLSQFQEKLNKDNTLTVRYEDLLLNTEEEVKRIVSFLGLDFESEMLAYYHQKSEDIEPAEFFQWKEKLTKPPDISNIGKYKNQLSADEIEIFNEIASKELAEFNYKV